MCCTASAVERANAGSLLHSSVAVPIGQLTPGEERACGVITEPASALVPSHVAERETGADCNAFDSEPGPGLDLSNATSPGTVAPARARRVSRAKRRYRRRAKAKWSRVPVSSLVFWNSRGFENDMCEFVRLLNDRGADAGFIMESRVYGNDLTSGPWHWHAGPEVLPFPGDSSPKRGLGAFVNARKHPGAIVVDKDSYKHSMWMRFSGATHDLFVCAAHVPLYSQPLGPM